MRLTDYLQLLYHLNLFLRHYTSSSGTCIHCSIFSFCPLNQVYNWSSILYYLNVLFSGALISDWKIMMENQSYCSIYPIMWDGRGDTVSLHWCYFQESEQTTSCHTLFRLTDQWPVTSLTHHDDNFFLQGPFFRVCLIHGCVLCYSRLYESWALVLDWLLSPYVKDKD